MVAKGPMIVTVSNKVPARTMLELFALARANPGKLNYGSSGQGRTNHFATELLLGAANIRMTHVPYKGKPPPGADLIGGRRRPPLPRGPPHHPHRKKGKGSGPASP